MNHYTLYILQKCNIDARHLQTYGELYELLNTIPYSLNYLRGLDVNRLRDGEYLKTCFKEDTGEETFSGCSILEVLIALCIRIEREYIGKPGDPHPEELFYDLIHNLDLERYTYDKFNRMAVLNIIRRWMWRKFDYNGYGSPFPLKHPEVDQRECEMWSQAMAYISEKYD